MNNDIKTPPGHDPAMRRRDILNALPVADSIRLRENQ